MGLFDRFGKRNVADDLEKQLPYAMKTEFVPYKLKANGRSSSSLFVSVKNLTKEPVMSSVVVEVPQKLNLDEIGMAKQKEVRIGMLAPNEEKRATVDIYAGPATDKGDYTLSVTAFVHYRDYGHVLNSMKKRIMISAV